MQPALTPWPLQVLLGRVAREWETRHRIFDLPSGKFHHVDPTADLGISVMGQALATSIGPAAGPHTQLAQNIVAGWLAGARPLARASSRPKPRVTSRDARVYSR